MKRRRARRRHRRPKSFKRIISGGKRAKPSLLSLARLLAKPSTRKELLNRKHHPRILTSFVRNLSRNIIEGNLNLNTRDKLKLAKHKNLIRKLASPNLKTPHRHVRISGGWLGTVLPLVLSLIVSNAGRLFAKKSTNNETKAVGV